MDFLELDLGNNATERNKLLPHEDFYMQHGIHLPSATIDIWNEIDQDSCERIVSGIRMIEHAHKKSRKYPELTVRLCSQGGDWYTGIAVFGALKAYPGKVRTIAMGNAMSMASVILQAGDIRCAYEYTTIMIHDGSESISGDVENVKKWTKHSEEVSKVMYGIYAEKSGKKSAYWKRRCSRDYILSAEAALKEGLIDKII